MGPENEEMPLNEVNLASRFINLSNITGRGIGKERNGPKNVLALSIPDSAEDDCAVCRGWAIMPSIWRVSALRRN